MASDPLKRRSGGGLVRSGGRTLALVSLVLALVVGYQLGAVPWRYRKQIWQLQGAVFGVVAGFVLGRLSRADPGESD